jgi:hypothetical protein
MQVIFEGSQRVRWLPLGLFGSFGDAEYCDAMFALIDD